MRMVWLIAVLVFVAAMTIAVVSVVRQMGLSDPGLNIETWELRRSRIVRVARSDMLWSAVGAVGLAGAAVLDAEPLFAVLAVFIVGPGCVALMLWYRESTWDLIARRLRQLR